MARANGQWQTLRGDQEALVIFQGAHAYVSPSWYETHPSVPTWNYLTVHAYGRPQPDRGRSCGCGRCCSDLVGQHEAPDSGWTMESAEEYVAKMVRNIVAFEMPISRLEGKFKLSQNRDVTDQRNVSATLSASADGVERAVGEAMKGSRASSRPHPSPFPAAGEGTVWLQTHRHAVVGHVAFDVADAVGAEVEDAGGEDGVGAAFLDGVDHVLGVAGAARGDDRHLDGVGDRARQGDVVAVEVAVGVHARDEQLAGAQLDDALRPLDRVEAGGAAAAVGVDLPASLARPRARRWRRRCTARRSAPKRGRRGRGRRPRRC